MLASDSRVDRAQRLLLVPAALQVFHHRRGLRVADFRESGREPLADEGLDVAPQFAVRIGYRLQSGDSTVG